MTARRHTGGSRCVRRCLCRRLRPPAAPAYAAASESCSASFHRTTAAAPRCAPRRDEPRRHPTAEPTHGQPKRMRARPGRRPLPPRPLKRIGARRKRPCSRSGAPRRPAARPAALIGRHGWPSPSTARLRVLQRRPGGAPHSTGSFTTPLLRARARCAAAQRLRAPASRASRTEGVICPSTPIHASTRRRALPRRPQRAPTRTFDLLHGLAERAPCLGAACAPFCRAQRSARRSPSRWGASHSRLPIATLPAAAGKGWTALGGAPGC